MNVAQHRPTFHCLDQSGSTLQTRSRRFEPGNSECDHGNRYQPESGQHNDTRPPATPERLLYRFVHEFTASFRKAVCAPLLSMRVFYLIQASTEVNLTIGPALLNHFSGLNIIDLPK